MPKKNRGKQTGRAVAHQFIAAYLSGQCKFPVADSSLKTHFTTQV